MNAHLPSLPNLVQEIKNHVNDLRKFEKLLDSVYTEEERKEAIISLDKELTTLNHKIEKMQLIHGFVLNTLENLKEYK